jgi:DNA-binding GntR family transcriptional regulator
MRFEISCCVFDELKRHLHDVEGSAAAASPIEPLEDRESIEERVAQSLRALIVTGRLPEGARLVQRDLAVRLGVSQTPVRASLGRLEREGFVVVGSTGRSFVSRLTREDFEEIYAARLGLEGLAARLGATAVDVARTDRMADVLMRLRSAAVKQDVDAYLALRWEFYETCYRASGRRRLVDEVERLYRRSERYNRLVLSSPERFRESLDRYEAFHSACLENDGGAAERIVQESLRWAVDRAGGGLPSEGASALDAQGGSTFPSRGSPRPRTASSR